jgi:hypothetical protein
LLAKNSQTGYRDLFLPISACWHSLARQDEAVNALLARCLRAACALLARWTDLQISELEMMAEGHHAKKNGAERVQFPA